MARFEITPVTTLDGLHYRWRLKDDTGRVIARGGTLYPSPAAARSDIEALRGCTNTPVVDTTGDSE